MPVITPYDFVNMSSRSGRPPSHGSRVFASTRASSSRSAVVQELSTELSWPGSCEADSGEGSTLSWTVTVRPTGAASLPAASAHEYVMV